MVQMLDPQPGDRIYDPTCGTGGTLISALAEVKRKGGEHRTMQFFGQERNHMTASIARAMPDLKSGWRRVKFGELANCINDRVEDPSKAGVDAGGSQDEVESTKLRFKPSDIIFGTRRA